VDAYSNIGRTYKIYKLGSVLENYNGTRYASEGLIHH